MSDRDEWVRLMADAILEDLLDRRGIKHELQAVRRESPDIFEELRLSIGRAALAAVEPLIRRRALETVNGKLLRLASIVEQKAHESDVPRLITLTAIAMDLRSLATPDPTSTRKDGNHE